MDKQIGRMMRNMALVRMTNLHSGEWSPAVDVYESEAEFLLCMDLAGADPEKVRIVAEQSRITITGERQALCHGFSRIHQLEIEYGQFKRTVPLPCPIDVGATSSCMKNGFLKIRMPKLRPKGRIQIQLT